MAALVAAAAAACLPAAGGAAPATTQPQLIYKVKVVLTSTAITVSPSKVRRGALAQIRVKNASSKPRDFFIGGYIVHLLKPGATRAFQLQFLNRGRFPYYSKGHPGAKISGSFVVT